VRTHYDRWFLGRVKRAIGDYSLFSRGDRVAVGVSGGKDSTTLLHALSLLHFHSCWEFELQAVFLDLGWGPVDLAPLEEFCAARKIPLHVRRVPIARILEARGEDNPCALCANLRRGVLHNTAKGLGCNKVALGHHLDDAIETFLLNLIYTGQLRAFKPKIYLDRVGLTLVRPLIYLPQSTIEAVVRREGLPVVPNPCPHTGHTRRQEMKELVTRLAAQYPDLRRKFLSAFKNVYPQDFWDPDYLAPGCFKRPGGKAAVVDNY